MDTLVQYFIENIAQTALFPGPVLTICVGHTILLSSLFLSSLLLAAFDAQLQQTLTPQFTTQRFQTGFLFGHSGAEMTTSRCKLIHSDSNYCNSRECISSPASECTRQNDASPYLCKRRQPDTHTSIRHCGVIYAKIN